MSLSGKRVLLIIAPKDFRDEEFLKPKEILGSMNAKITVASKGVTRATGMFGTVANVDIDINKVDVKDYDAIVFVGGVGSSTYFNDPTALKIAKEAYEQGKVVAAICIAPSILANAGILKGKSATSFPSEAENLRAKGAKYTGEPVTVDGKVITARGPEAASQFGEAIAKALAK
ncbi:MAG: DJ-1/PfpI family protein [Candidatus Bathyarchaeia archaeon]